MSVRTTRATRSLAACIRPIRRPAATATPAQPTIRAAEDYVWVGLRPTATMATSARPTPATPRRVACTPTTPTPATTATPAPQVTLAEEERVIRGHPWCATTTMCVRMTPVTRPQGASLPTTPRPATTATRAPQAIPAAEERVMRDRRQSATTTMSAPMTRVTRPRDASVPTTPPPVANATRVRSATLAEEERVMRDRRLSATTTMSVPMTRVTRPRAASLPTTPPPVATATRARQTTRVPTERA